MKKNLLLVLLSLCIFCMGRAQTINEIDADTPLTDVAEFVELLGTPGASLDGYVLVFYNGSTDLSYLSLDLDGLVFDANGLVLIANSGVAGADLIFADNLLQNGADAVALYTGNATDFPNSTPVTSTNLVDAIVYGTNDANDTGLLTGLGETVQFDEGTTGTTSLAWDGSTFISDATPSPNELNGSSCSITGVTTTTAVCSGSDVTFDVAFDPGVGAGNFEVINSATSAVLGTSAFSPITATIVGPTTASTINIVVGSQDTPTCVSSAIAVSIPTCPVPACSIVLGTASYTCVATTSGSSDEVIITIPYTGGPEAGTTVTGSGTVGGDDPAVLAAGNITMTGAESAAWNISISGGDCVTPVTANGTVPATQCTPVCSLALGTPVITCIASTAGTTDAVSITIPFTGGPEAGVLVTGSGTISGDDPATMTAGNIIMAGTEGSAWNISVSGGDCPTPLTASGTISTTQCPAPLACTHLNPSACGVASIEDFNCFAGTAATLPASWVSSSIDYIPGGYYTFTDTYNSSNSTYALGNASDAAYGNKYPTSGTGELLTYCTTNTTGVEINSIDVAWDVEQYSAGPRATTIDLSYSLDGTSFTQAGITGTSLTTATTQAVAANLAAVQITARAISITGLAIAPGATYCIRYTIANGAGSGSNAHIGVDNISITPQCSTSCGMISLSYGTPGSCNDNGTPSIATDDYYTVDITVSYANAPATGTLDLTGASLHSSNLASNISYTGPFGTTHTFTGVRLLANNTASSVTATFTDTPACTITNMAGATVAPCSTPPACGAHIGTFPHQ